MSRTFFALVCVLAAAGCATNKSKTDGRGSDVASPTDLARRQNEGGGDAPAATSPSRGTNVFVERNDGLSDSDRRLADSIRRRIRDGDFSGEGRDVQVDVRNGRVTLSGMTQTMTERELILRIARQEAGFDNVDSRLEVEPRR